MEATSFTRPNEGYQMSDDRYLHINRIAAREDQLNNLDIDFLQGHVDIDKLSTYDEADAWDKQGGPNLAKDDNKMAKDTAIEYSEHRGKLSADGEYQPSRLELKRAEVAAKIAAYMLPHANAESIENQAAILARRLTSSELKEMLERVYCDYKGAKIAAQHVDRKRRAMAAEEAELDQVSKLANEFIGASVGADDVEEEELAEDLESDAPTSAMMHGRTSADEELVDEAPVEEEEPVEEPEAEEALAASAETRFTAGKRMNAKPISRTASQKGKSPRITHPRRKVASQVSEEEKLAEIYNRKLGNPTDEEFNKVMSLFAD